MYYFFNFSTILENFKPNVGTKEFTGFSKRRGRRGRGGGGDLVTLARVNGW